MKNIICIFLVVAFGTQAFAEADKELGYWKKTGVTYKILEERYVNETRCLESQKNFLGCVDALTLLAQKQTGEPKAVLSSKHVIAKEDVIQVVGDLMIVKDRQLIDLRAKGLKGLQAYQLRKDYNKGLDKVWLAVYSQASTLKLPFSQILKQITANIDANKEPMVAAYAINEFMASAIDPHSYIQSSASLQEQATSSDSKFVGIGLVFQDFEGVKKVQKVVPHGPAEKAGIQLKDVIVAVDGKDVTKISLEDTIALIKGNEGTPVAVLVTRGEQTIKFDMTRAPVVIPNLQAEVVATPNGKNIGYIQLSTFMGQNVCLDFTQNLVRFQLDNTVDGAVVDLRSNGGGSLAIVACMLDAFLPSGAVVISTHIPETDEVESVLKTRDPRIFFKKSLVVLVDGYSASASEIFAGAVQDHKLGYVVGTRSYGKGTVQELREDLTLPGVTRAQTVGRFHLPSGRTNQIVGITPDFEAYASPNPKDEEKYFEREEDRYRTVVKTANTQRLNFIERLGSTRACVNARPDNQKRYSLHDDFQLLVAEDVIACDAPALKVLL